MRILQIAEKKGFDLETERELQLAKRLDIDDRLENEIHAQMDEDLES